MSIDMQKWESFFDSFKALSKDELSLNNFESFFDAFQKLYTPFLEEGGAINVWEIAGIGHNEVRNCAVLGWLLDRYGTHGQKSFFLRKLLNFTADKDLNDLAKRLDTKPYTISVEKSYNISEDDIKQIEQERKQLKQRNRVDFVIENDEMLIFIEAKIYANEGEQQIGRYIKNLQQLANGRTAKLLFLTTTGRFPESIENTESIITLSWNDIANCFENAIKEKNIRTYKTSQHCQTWIYPVQQFCWHIRQF